MACERKGEPQRESGAAVVCWVEKVRGKTIKHVHGCVIFRSYSLLFHTHTHSHTHTQTHTHTHSHTHTRNMCDHLLLLLLSLSLFPFLLLLSGLFLLLLFGVLLLRLLEGKQRVDVNMCV
jgi:flagellar biosynthesis protein FliP